MGGLLFVSQAVLDSWVEQGRIDVVGNVMTLRAGEGEGRSYALEPAVRFLRRLGAGPDPYALVQKVKSTPQLRALGAEALGDSCLVGDEAYEIQPGYLAESAALQAAAVAVPGRAASPRPPAAGRAPAGPAALRADTAAERKRKEAEVLARFLLENPT